MSKNLFLVFKNNVSDECREAIERVVKADGVKLPTAIYSYIDGHIYHARTIASELIDFLDNFFEECDKCEELRICANSTLCEDCVGDEMSFCASCYTDEDGEIIETNKCPYANIRARLQEAKDELRMKKNAEERAKEEADEEAKEKKQKRQRDLIDLSNDDDGQELADSERDEDAEENPINTDRIERLKRRKNIPNDELGKI